MYSCWLGIFSLVSRKIINFGGTQEKQRYRVQEMYVLWAEGAHRQRGACTIEHKIITTYKTAEDSHSPVGPILHGIC